MTRLELESGVTTLLCARHVYNNPVKYQDPSGHCSGDPGGVGNTQDQHDCWRIVRTIDQGWNNYWEERFIDQETLWDLAAEEGLGTDYWSQQWDYYLKSDFYQNEIEQLPMREQPSPLEFGDYTSVSGSFVPFFGFLGGSIIIDDFGNVYINFHLASTPGASLTRGDVYVNNSQSSIFGEVHSVNELSVDEQEAVIQEALTGGSSTILSAGHVVGAGVVTSFSGQYVLVNGGLYTPGVAADLGYSFLFYDHGATRPFPWWPF